MGNNIARDIHCDITMGNDIAMFTYHGITMHNNIAMNLFYYVFSALCQIMMLLRVVWNKTRTSSSLICLGWRTHELFLCGTISLILHTSEISLHKHNSSPDWSSTHLFLLYDIMENCADFYTLYCSRITQLKLIIPVRHMSPIAHRDRTRHGDTGNILCYP